MTASASTRTRSRHGGVVALLLGTLFSMAFVPALAQSVPATQERAVALVARMVEAARTLNYDATFVYTHGMKMDEMRIIHRYHEGAEQERLVTLSGTTREVLRDDTRVTCIIPDSQSVVVGKSRPQAVYGSALLTAEGYLPYYRLRTGGMARVAGRSAELVVVEPRDEFRYGYRLWVDEASGLLLRSELVGEDGQALEGVTYTSLRVSDSIPDSLLAPEISGTGFTWYTSKEPAAPGETESNWAARWVPPGFTMRDRESTPLPAGRAPLEHLVYGDGLASLSIYVERLEEGARALEGSSTMGAMSAYGTMQGMFQVTVVGEVPARTVRRVGKAVDRRQ